MPEEACALPASDRQLDSLAFIIPFLVQSFCFDFSTPGPGHMICGAQGFSILVLYFSRAGLGHHRPTPFNLCISVMYPTDSIISSMVMKSHDRILGQGSCASTPSAQGVVASTIPGDKDLTYPLLYRAMSLQTLLPRSDLLPTEVWGTQYNYALPEGARTSTRWRPHFNCVSFYALPQLIIFAF